jgi:O-antigen/teichoic acid export membrane protein
LFGGEYAANGETVMRILAPGLLPAAFLFLAVAYARVRRQVGRLLVVSVVYAAISIPLSVWLVTWLGIEGAGLSWLVGQSAGAAIALAVWSVGVFEGRAAEPLAPNNSGISHPE